MQLRKNYGVKSLVRSFVYFNVCDLNFFTNAVRFDVNN